MFTKLHIILEKFILPLVVQHHWMGGTCHSELEGLRC